MSLPKPTVVRCFFEPSFESPLPAMELCWDADGQAERIWRLPMRVDLSGPAPERFGITLRRTGNDSYHLRMLWNDLSLCWDGLTRTQIMASSLTLVLDALGTDLWYLLSQPADEAGVAA